MRIGFRVIAAAFRPGAAVQRKCDFSRFRHGCGFSLTAAYIAHRRA
jgi:hypothetical protein